MLQHYPIPSVYSGTPEAVKPGPTNTHPTSATMGVEVTGESLILCGAAQ